MKTAEIIAAANRARALLAGGDSEPIKADTTKMIAEALIALQDQVFEKALAGDVVELETPYSPAIIWAQTARMSGLINETYTVKSGNGRTLVAVELPRNVKLVHANWPSLEMQREADDAAQLGAAIAKFAKAVAGRPRSGDQVVLDAVGDLVGFALGRKIVDERTALPWAR